MTNTLTYIKIILRNRPRKKFGMSPLCVKRQTHMLNGILLQCNRGSLKGKNSVAKYSVFVTELNSSPDCHMTMIKREMGINYVGILDALP